MHFHPAPSIAQAPSVLKEWTARALHTKSGQGSMRGTLAPRRRARSPNSVARGRASTVMHCEAGCACDEHPPCKHPHCMC